MIRRAYIGAFCYFVLFLTINLHSPERRLIELQIEHADLDAWIDRVDQELPADQLMLRRLKKRRLILRAVATPAKTSPDPT